MLLVEAFFPLLILVAPKRYDAATVRTMAETFEPFYSRGERYALLSFQPSDSVAPTAHERKLLTDWINSAHVRENAGRLCVASAAVVTSAVMRGALTAILWFWKPPFPLHVAANAEEGIDHCLSRLIATGVPLGAAAANVKLAAMQRLEAELGLPVPGE